MRQPLYCLPLLALTIAPRIISIEQQIGAGLIEEIIQVAEGEVKLVDTMMESRV